MLSMTDGELTNVLLGIIGTMLMLAWQGVRSWVKKVEIRLEKLSGQREECMRMFVLTADNAEDHRRIHKRIDELGSRVTLMERE